MKITQIIPNFGFGGAEIMCENLIYELKAQGHEINVISLYDFHSPITERLENKGVKICYLDKKPGLDLSMVSKIAKKLRKDNPEVVHSHLDCIKYAVPAARKAKVKRCVHTVHNVADKEASGLARILNKFFFKNKWVTPIALSPKVQESIALVYKLKKETIPVVYNGIDLSKCISKKEYKLDKPIRLIHVGRFSEQKNHKGLIESFSLIRNKYSDITLTLVGDGEKREEIEVLVKELKLEGCLEFLGHQSNVYPLLQEADIFLLPSLYEGMPMTIVEAMGTGLPIVATNVGGVSDMLNSGEEGLLVPCDVAAIADACLTFLEDENLRKLCGQNAQRRSLEFSAAHMAKRYCEIYNKNK